MSTIALISSQPWVERLGWTLLHFLWQGLVISLVYACARRVARAAGPGTRYLLGCLALAMMAVMPVVTWSSLSSPAAPAFVAASLHAAPADATTAVAAVPLLFRFVGPREAPSTFLPWVVALWLAGSAALWLRLIGGWLLAARLRSRMVRPASTEWQQVLRCLQSRLHVAPPVRLLVSPRVFAPIVVGWLRPIILMPVAVLVGLPREQVEALLAHELAHIRRADYLVNVLQSIVEALLFYHPAVWWISGHIREERELCCDDAAVSLTGDAILYASALAELEAARSGQLRIAVAATGGSLLQRIARLLGEPRQAARTGLPAVFAGAALLAAAALVLAQSAAASRFEVASVKPSQETRFMTVRVQPGGRLVATSPVRLLIQNAYQLQAFQIVGGPSWIDSDRYQIEAKGDTKASHDQVMQMLQSLLADRFQLKAHEETRELPVFALVQTKSGSKLAPPKEGSCLPVAEGAPMPPPTPGQPLRLPCGRAGLMGMPGGVRLQGSAVAMPEFTRTLAMVLGRPVVDRTSLGGTFDVKLEFALDTSAAGLPMPVGAAGPAASSAADQASPTIFTAVQEQLGLKLESTKGPVRVLVIDSVERPSAN